MSSMSMIVPAILKNQRTELTVLLQSGDLHIKAKR